MSQAEIVALIELVGFVLIIFALVRYVYPLLVVPIVERQQRAIAAQLEAADKTRAEAEEQLRKAQSSVGEARGQASQIIERANRAAERIQQDAQQKAREESERIVQGAGRDIDVERQRTVQSIRQQMADLVIQAVARVVRENLDGQRQRELVEAAIRKLEREPSAAG